MFTLSEIFKRKTCFCSRTISTKWKYSTFSFHTHLPQKAARSIVRLEAIGHFSSKADSMEVPPFPPKKSTLENLWILFYESVRFSRIQLSSSVFVNEFDAGETIFTRGPLAASHGLQQQIRSRAFLALLILVSLLCCLCLSTWICHLKRGYLS